MSGINTELMNDENTNIGGVIPNPRLRSNHGIIDDQSVLTFDNYHVANLGENLVTELEIILPHEILDTYNIYLEFLLPTRERFISEALLIEHKTIEVIDDKTRQPISKDVSVVRYRLKKYIVKVSGTLVMNLKAVNDSVTIYKSKTANLTIDNSVDVESDDRYFRGDLLDYIVSSKIDTMKYIKGWLHVYTTNPSTGELTDLGKFPINPLFESYESALEFAKNEDESTIGQLVTVVLPDDHPVAPGSVTAYLINSDRTLSHVMTEGSVILDTITEPGVLQPESDELIDDRIRLSRVSKSGMLSDTLNNRKFLSMIELKNDLVVDSIAREGETLSKVIINSIIINKPLNSNGKFEIWYRPTSQINYVKVLDNTQIDTTIMAEYELNLAYMANYDAQLKIVIDYADMNRDQVDIRTRIQFN